MKKDKIHYNFCKVDSHNKPFNFVISPREPGKSTCAWNKVYKRFDRTKQPSIAIRRLITDITDIYIGDIEKSINKFLPLKKQIKLNFKKGSIKDGVVDVFINDFLFLRVIALSNPMSRIKSTVIRNPAFIIFDEFICNLRMGEKYLKNEAFRFKEIYNTYQRECDGYILKCYFLGNPYSLYNPYFADLNINTLLLKPGAFLVGDIYCIDVYKLRQELIEKLKKNPLYKIDDSYTRYAFDGSAVNDSNILLEPKKPDQYKLKYIFKLNQKYILVYKDNRTREYIGSDPGKYWIQCTTTCESSKKIYAIDFDNMEQGSILIDVETRIVFQRLKIAIGRRDCTFETIEASYLTETIFDII